MDPADPLSVERAVSSQGTLLGQHHQMLQSLTESQGALSQQVIAIGKLVEDLANKLAVVPAASANQQGPNQIPAVMSETPVPPPEPYCGEVGKTKGFLLQCSQVFNQQPQTFASDQAKVSYVTGLLRGRALEWAQAVLGDSTNPPIYARFLADFKKVFAHPDIAADAAKRLLSLRQGLHSVAEYSIDFRILAAESGWNDHALRGAFQFGLNETMKDELASHDESVSLDDLISLSIRLDNRLRERRRERNTRTINAPSTRPACAPVVRAAPSPSQPPPLLALPSTEEPMQLGRARLTPGERQRRISLGECLYCGQSGHFLRTCPIRPKDQAHQ